MPKQGYKSKCIWAEAALLDRFKKKKEEKNWVSSLEIYKILISRNKEYFILQCSLDNMIQVYYMEPGVKLTFSKNWLIVSSSCLVIATTKPNMHRRVGDSCLFLFRCYWLNVYQDPKEMNEKSRTRKGNVGERQIRKKYF